MLGIRTRRKGGIRPRKQAGDTLAKQCVTTDTAGSACVQPAPPPQRSAPRSSSDGRARARACGTGHATCFVTRPHVATLCGHGRCDKFRLCGLSLTRGDRPPRPPARRQRLVDGQQVHRRADFGTRPANPCSIRTSFLGRAACRETGGSGFPNSWTGMAARAATRPRRDEPGPFARHFNGAWRRAGTGSRPWGASARS